MTRILQLVASDRRRGAETFAYHLANQLAASGFETRTVAVAGDGDSDGLPFEVAGRSRRDPAGLRRIAHAARWSDVVIGCGSTTLIAGAAITRIVGRPFIYRSIGDPAHWAQARLADVRVGAPARAARHVVALFPAAAATFSDRYRVPADRLSVITNGVPAHDFHRPDEATVERARRRLGLDPGRPWVGLIGALSPEKDPMLAIEAVNALDHVGLVVAGGGPLDAELRTAAAQLGDRVRFLGVTSDVASVYSALDALVLPSKTEGVPAVAIEAALCEIPVVATDVGGVSTVVLDRDTGRLLDQPDAAAVADGITDALDHSMEWGVRARRHALDNFTMDVVAEQWAGLIRRVLGTTGQVGGPA